MMLQPCFGGPRPGPRRARRFESWLRRWRTRLGRVVASVLLAGYALEAGALQPLITDDTGTQAAGGNQLELEASRESLAGPEGKGRALAATAVYSRGLTDALEIYAGHTQLRIRSTGSDEDADGRSNPVVGLKWRLWEDEQRGLSLGVKPEVQFGISTRAESRGLGSGRTGYSGTLIVTRKTDFGEVHVNLAHSRTSHALAESRQANRRSLTRLSVAPVFEVSPALLLALDAGITTNPDRSQRKHMGYVELAAIWTPGKDLELALGHLAQVRDGESRTRTWIAGVTWRFR